MFAILITRRGNSLPRSIQFVVTWGQNYETLEVDERRSTVRF